MLTWYWLLAVAPALVYPAICRAYWSIIQQKRQEIRALLSGQDRLDLYVQAYAPAGQTDKEPFASLFEVTYQLSTFIAAIAMNMILTTAVAATALARTDLPLGFAGPLQDRILAISPAVFAGFAGAYVWGLYDILRRYRTADLSSVALHFVWLKMLLAGVLAALTSSVAQEPFDLLLAFALGALPFRELVIFLQASGRERLRIERTPEEPANLHTIQGMNSTLLERFADEGIERVTHLAFADPVRLLLRTNFEWKLILDFIDQALLVNYLGPKVDRLRVLGVRGVIELADVAWDLADAKKRESGESELMLQALGKELGVPPLVVSNFISTLEWDPHIKFIRHLWSTASPPADTATSTSYSADDVPAETVAAPTPL